MRLSKISVSLVAMIGMFFLSVTALTTCSLQDGGSKWVQINEPGFGNANNYSIAAMAEYQGYLYAMTRNEVQGAEMYRYNGSWEQVLFPDNETNGLYGNPWINNLWGDMVVFNNHLYCAFTSGVQGYVLKSTGCEIWRFDGNIWEPVISDRKDVDDSGFITAIAGCDDDDGDTTAHITDETKLWDPDALSGGILQITSGNGKFRRFAILGNTEDTLTVQQHEVVNDGYSEYTICSSQTFENPFPPYDYQVGVIAVGDSYEIGLGQDESGFGDTWNKAIPDMEVFEGRLYAGTGLNLLNGAQVWYTDDGDNWQLTFPANSLGLYHNDALYDNGLKPVVGSIPGMAVSAVSGIPVLYAGAATADGDLGTCARLAKLTDTGWELLVDSSIDDNTTGTNENGFGDGMDCTMFTGNFVPWTLTEFNERLFVSIQSLAGVRIMYTLTGGTDDGSWFYSVGGDADIPNGFDGEFNGGYPSIYQNIAANLFTFQDSLYAGIISTYAPTVGATQDYLTGSQLWKSNDGISWQCVTANGFDDEHIIAFEAFGTYNDTLFVAGNKGCVDCPYGLDPAEGCKVFKLVETL
jgi:hypothetical protein